MIQIFAALALLGICVFFHELGHFLIGKWLGVKPKIFSIGYGKGRIVFRRNRTVYQITAIPLGGYVQFFGDDPTKEYKKLVKGSFFKASPWVRMAIAGAGPFFSLLLGFVVLVVLMLGGWQPTSNEINLAQVGIVTPAQRAGLKNGDKIIAVNNHETNSFERVAYHIGVAPERKVVLTVKRKGKQKPFNVLVTAEVNQAGRPQFIGIQRQGRMFLVNNTDKIFSNGSVIKKGDEIRSINGVVVDSIQTLKPILTKNIGQTVNLEVHRNIGGVISPEKYEKLTIVAPVTKKEYVHLNNIIDLQTGIKVSNKSITFWKEPVSSGFFDFFNSDKDSKKYIEKNNFSNIYIDGKNYQEWKSFKKAILQKIKKSAKGIFLSIGPVKIKADVKFSYSGFLGLQLARGIDPKKANLDSGLLASMQRSMSQIVFITKSTVVGLYRIIEGKLSFNASVTGPIRIVKLAGEQVKYGWVQYWYFLAMITIVLGVMNLLPIPVLDGGHIVFYLIEAIYKPLPIKVIAALSRGAMVLLITMGIYVIGLDLFNIIR